MEPFKVYPLYNDYEFVYENNKDIKSAVTAIRHLPGAVPDNFYDVAPLQISISVVVGKNGSGKSSPKLGGQFDRFFHFSKIGNLKLQISYHFVLPCFLRINSKNSKLKN